MLHLLLTVGACTESPATSANPTSSPGSVPPASPPGTDAVPSEVSVFQAVEVPLVVDGAEVVDRNAPVVAGRDAIVRVRFDGAADGVALDVASGGATETFTGAADGAGDLIVAVPGSALAADARWTVRVTDGGAEVARFPSAGDAVLGAIETGPLSLVLVPFEVDGLVPDTSDAVVEGYRQAVLATYPVTDVVVAVDPVQTWTGALDLGAINVQLGVIQEQAMIAGDVDWDVYYFGLVTAASREVWEGPTGTSEDGGSEELVRAYFATGAAFADQTSEDTLIHELGHVHGLDHAPCDGESDVDPDFPYADGTIGVEGYDRRTDAFVPADTMDMMTYCYPRWVSDYDFAKMAVHVANAQDYRGYE